jgi:hypothetical protein
LTKPKVIAPVHMALIRPSSPEIAGLSTIG